MPPMKRRRDDDDKEEEKEGCNQRRLISMWISFGSTTTG